MDYSNIPQELRNLKQWGNFHKVWVPERNKYTKIPINSWDGSPGKSNDSSTWADFETALRGLDKYENADGLAFYFANGYVGLDVDHIKDELEDYYQNSANLVYDIQQMTKNSYREISISGEGIHVIFKGQIPGKRRRKGQFEMYQKGRFFALTGNTMEEKMEIASLNQDEMKTLYEYLFGKDKTVPLHPDTDSITSIDLSVTDIIKRAEASPKVGKRFTMFMKGGWDQFYTSQSEADMAFANDLAFWCGRNFHKMDVIFRNSSLMRDKYDEKHGATTYGVSLLNKAINETANIYDPANENKKPDIVFSFNEKSKKQTPNRSWDDTGRGQRLNDQLGSYFKWMASDKTWYFYNGSYWELDNGRHIELAAEKVVNSLRTEKPDFSFSTKTDQNKMQKEWLKFCKDSRSHMAKVHMIDEFKKYVTVDHGEFDHDNMLLNTQSGYVDLSNGELKDHDIKKLFSQQTASEYSDSTDCPLWDEFLKQIFRNDEELIHYIQKAVGYSLTGSTAEQVMFLLLGSGRNGKSVFINTIRNIAGSYAKQMNVESIVVHNSGGSANSDIARLENTRLVTSSEANEGSRMDESLVKQLTGGDKILARFLYGMEFEYTPKFKIWMATNHLPLIRGTDEGIWRRLKVIPFDVQIPKDKIDKNLESKLKSEWTGILNWIVQGAIMWQREGLEDPERVKEASREYRESMDPLDAFLNEMCEDGSEYSVKARDLYTAYSQWAKDSREYDMPFRKFGREMSKKLPKKRKKDGFYYLGIKLEKEPIKFNWN